jgi:hypothetical protein
VPNQKNDGLASTTKEFELPCVRASNTGLTSSAQHPEQPHGQRCCDGHLRHRSASAELQPKVAPPFFWIEALGCLGSFDQQVAHHRVALLAD